VRDVRLDERPPAEQRQLDLPRVRGRDGRMTTRCPGCGRSSDAGHAAYLVVCAACAGRTAARDLPLRGLPQSTSCGGLCAGTGLVWEDVPLAEGGSEQRLVRCPCCG
jgi:ribosomal protein S27E